MKTFVAIIALSFAAVVLAETPLEKLRQYSDGCKAESGVSDELLAKARKGEDINDPKLDAHGFCILKKAGFQDAEGKLQIDTIKTKLTAASNNAEGVEKVVQKCAVQKDTPTETSKHFFKCLHEAREQAKAH